MAAAIPYMMFAISAGSAIASYQASNAQADAASKAAWDNYNAQQNQLAEQRNQIQAQSQNEANERSKAAMMDKATIKNAAGESGVSGLSLDRLINDADFQSSMDIGSITTNRNNRLKQNAAESQASYANAASTINKANASRGTALGAGLQIAGSAYTAGKDLGYWGKKP